MDNDANSLDALLDGALPENAKVEAETPTPEAEQPAATGEKEPHSAPPAEATGHPSQPAENEGPLVPRKALEDERRKRQERDKQFDDLQRQFAAMQTQIAQPQQPQQPPPKQEETPPDPWTDPQGALEYQQRKFGQQLYETRLYTSEAVVRAQVPDYDDLVKVFVEAARRSPRLQSEIVNHPFPANYVVETARRIKFISEVGNDPEAYDKRVIEKWQASQQQAMPAQSQSETPKVAVPKSLAGTPSAQPRNAKGQWTGPASLDDILGG